MLCYHRWSTDKQIKLKMYLLNCGVLEQLTRRAAQYNKHWTLMMTTGILMSYLTPVCVCLLAELWIYFERLHHPLNEYFSKVLSWTSEEGAINQPRWGWPFMNQNGGLPVVHVHAVDWSDPFKLSANSSLIQHTHTRSSYKGGMGGRGSISSSIGDIRLCGTLWFTQIKGTIRKKQADL